MGKAAVLVIDLQQEFTRRTEAGMRRSNPGAETKIAQVLTWARGAGVDVVHVHHDDPSPKSMFRMDKPGGAPMECARPLPNEAVFVKTTSGAYASTDLADHWLKTGVSRVIIMGAAINYCVASTIRAGRDLGIAQYVVTDAVFGFDVTGPDGEIHAAETVLSVTIGTLAPEFAQAIAADAVAEILAH